MAGTSIQDSAELVKTNNDEKIMEEIETAAICSGGKMIEVKVCKLLAFASFSEIFASLEKTLPVRVVADFCVQYDKFFPYKRNSFFFLVENKEGCSVIEMYGSRRSIENEGYPLNSKKILLPETRVVIPC